MRRIKLDYNETATFVIAESDGYRGARTMVEQYSVECMFVQNTGFSNANHQELLNTDALLYADIANEFIVDNYYRLEGMYVMISPFGASEAVSWYRIDSITVNRDHLLKNEIDNVACLLKKAESIPGVS